MLTALLRPDYTDEEIRREVAHVEAVPGPGGSLRLEEKGTVYNEMVSTTQEANSVIWQQVRTLSYGKGHPLAREAGGLPEGIRSLSPAEVRGFHAANYHLGPNMAAVAVLPLSWSIEDFLQRLHAVFEKVEPDPPRLSPAPMPPPPSAGPAQIRIGKFPSADKSAPQGVVMSWPPLSALSLRDEFRTSLLLSVLGGGETSLLQRDLVDGKTRLLDTGATGVGTYLDDGLLPLPTVSVGGLRLEAITRPMLARLRTVVQRRIRWLTRLAPGSPELARIAERARLELKAYRRSVLKSLDDAPGFGQNNAAASWHRYLDTLEREAGFRADLLPEAIFAELDRDLVGGQNLWRPIAERAGLLGRPHVIAVRPDATLLARQQAARTARIRGHLRELKARFAERDEQATLAAFKQAFDASTRAVQARNDEVRLPSFLASPPLTRDDAPFVRGKLPGEVPLVRTHFDSTVFTDLSLAFDLGALDRADDELVILLATLDSLGVTTKEGEVLDYATTEERVRASVYTLGVGLGLNPTTGRAELMVGGSASTAEEIGRLVEWMDTFLNRPRLDPTVRERLLDVVRGRVQGLRGLFQADPDRWAGQIAAAIDYQHQPLYLATSSPFTALYHLARLRWRLEDPASGSREKLRAALAGLAGKLEGGDRTAVTKQVATLEGDLGEHLRFELDHLPTDSWQRDFTRVVREIRADLEVAPQTVLDRLRGLLAKVKVRGGLRVQITSSAANADRAARALEPLLAALPAGTRPTAARRPDRPAARAPGGPIDRRLGERYAGQAIGPHLALVHDSSSGASHYIQVPGPDYRAPGREAVMDLLTVGLLAGGGPSSLFMRTWAAGLAYSSGLAAHAINGRIIYVAHRCPDPVETMRFVSGLTRAAKVDPDLVQASLAYAFSDYGGADSFSTRGARIGGDLIDGLDPDQVRAFKTQVLETARAPGTAEELARRLPGVVGRLLVGAGGKVSSDASRVALLVGPSALLDRYEAFLKETGEAKLFPRLYPRDFWPPEAR